MHPLNPAVNTPVATDWDDSSQKLVQISGILHIVSVSLMWISAFSVKPIFSDIAAPVIPLNITVYFEFFYPRRVGPVLESNPDSEIFSQITVKLQAAKWDNTYSNAVWLYLIGILT